MTVFGETDSLAANPRSVSFQRVPYGSPASIFFKLAPEYDYAFLLESRTGLGNTALYSYVGFGPAVTVRLKDGIATVNERQVIDNGANAAIIGSTFSQMVEENLNDGSKMLKKLRALTC